MLHSPCTPRRWPPREARSAPRRRRTPNHPPGPPSRPAALSSALLPWRPEPTLTSSRRCGKMKTGQVIKLTKCSSSRTPKCDLGLVSGRHNLHRPNDERRQCGSAPGWPGCGSDGGCVWWWYVEGGREAQLTLFRLHHPPTVTVCSKQRSITAGAGDDGAEKPRGSAGKLSHQISEEGSTQAVIYRTKQAPKQSS